MKPSFFRGRAAEHIALLFSSSQAFCGKQSGPIHSPGDLTFRTFSLSHLFSLQFNSLLWEEWARSVTSAVVPVCFVCRRRPSIHKILMGPLSLKCSSFGESAGLHNLSVLSATTKIRTQSPSQNPPSHVRKEASQETRHKNSPCFRRDGSSLHGCPFRGACRHLVGCWANGTVDEVRRSLSDPQEHASLWRARVARKARWAGTSTSRIEQRLTLTLTLTHGLIRKVRSPPSPPPIRRRLLVQLSKEKHGIKKGKHIFTVMCLLATATENGIFFCLFEANQHID